VCIESRERREIIFMIIIKHWKVTLSCTVAFSGYKGNIGYLPWVTFYDFFELFPKFRKGNKI
jgi:hypothetical protein